ncbi:MAG: glycoside hydrolase family 127 protein [Anaerolineae bacterium]
MPRNPGVVDTTFSPYARLRPVPVSDVTLGDGFWQPRLRANHQTSLPRLYALYEEKGVLDNFRRLNGSKNVARRGYLFTDSDLYKWVEAAAFVLQSEGDPALERLLDGVIETILSVQQPDGYLNTYWIAERADQRFTDLPGGHELYCAGHLFQAAIALYRANGDRRLLDASTRFADYLCSRFQPQDLPGNPGHPEIELALVELYRVTGARRYLDLADYFLTQNGFRTRTIIEGHAVVANYQACGAADLYAECGDAALLDASLRLWQSMVSTKMYVTGGVGGRYLGESYGRPFELPQERAYSETCAAIANAIWNWRLLAITGEAQYTDLMERALYNGFLSGVSLGGDEYFYINPLADSGAGEGDPENPAHRRDPYQRKPWYNCTCCPPNVQRMLASLPGYLFSTNEEGLWVHLYDACTLKATLPGGTPLRMSVDTRYPWEGTVRLHLSPAVAQRFTLRLRIPAWCRNANLEVNGQPVCVAAAPGSYAALERTWQPGDTVQLDLAMPVDALEADPRLAECRGSVALQRGPLVYCLEGVDHGGADVRDTRIALSTLAQLGGITAEHHPELLGGMTLLHAPGWLPEHPEAQGPLYRVWGQEPAPLRPTPLTAVPYYAWCNRGPNAMTVWIQTTP